MISLESEATAPTNFLPDNLEELIANSLISTGYPGSHTNKYFLRGHPELLVRYTNNDTISFDKLESIAHTFNKLPEYGIPSLPYIPMKQGDKSYVVTYNVSGDCLENILANGKGDELAPIMDETWGNLVAYFMLCKETGLEGADDIITPGQYMYGTILNEQTPQLWLVDLDEYTTAFTYYDTPHSFGYEGHVLDLTTSILSIEKQLEQPLVKSRAMLESAFTTIPVPAFIEHLRAGLRRGELEAIDGDGYAEMFDVAWWE